MKRGLKILNSLVVITISGFSVIACGQGNYQSPNKVDYWRSEIARLEASKETTDDADEIATINQKIDRLVAEWVSMEISSIHAFGFKIELEEPTLWKDILQKMIPNCFSEYFSSHSDLKKYFNISKLSVPDQPKKLYSKFPNRYYILYNYDNYPTDEIKGPSYIEIVNDNLIEK